jgi:predicted phage terminase large subunit-like protein
MKSGIIVKANARHPFLVQTDGGLEWRRTGSIRPGDIIQRAIGASGAVSFAQQKAATSPPNARASAGLITAGIGGPADIAPLLSTLSRAARLESSIDIKLTQKSTTACLPSKVGFARFVGSPQSLDLTHAPTGPVSFALTTVTTPAKSEDSCATIATSWSATEKPQTNSSQALSTYEIVGDVVLEVVESGVEHVFDIQVDRTENFIANGLVSHNTRWHEDDLSGWLLANELEEPEGWHVVSLPAIKEPVNLQLPPTCTLESDWREPGEPVCPERTSLARLEKIRGTIGTYFWGALYQQHPTPLEGDFFNRKDWRRYDNAPTQFEHVVLSFDCAFKETKSSDFVVGIVVGKVGGDYYVLDVLRDRTDINGTLAMVQDLSAKWPMARAKLVEDKANGPAVIDLLRRRIAGMLPVNPQGGKIARAAAVSPYVESGNVWLPRSAPWVSDFVEEMASFPNGAYDDQVDAFSQAINWLESRCRTVQMGQSFAAYG